MSGSREKRSIEDWNGVSVAAGESRNVELAVSEGYSGLSVNVPIRVCRARRKGPVVFVTAAVHGDEINGTGAIRQLLQDATFELRAGAIILVPVLNLLAFERHSRYLPDRRDLNRCFPGSDTGSLAARMAHRMFDEIVTRCDFGIDLHTAAVRRTNYPNVRGDMKRPEVARIAKAFGAEIIINGKGPLKGFRREATRFGCPTIVMEGGEVWKVEPGIVKTMVRGVKNVLRELEMLDGKLEVPPVQVQVETSKWIRAERGGFLQFHIGPGDIIEKGQPLTTNTTLRGEEVRVLEAPFNAIVIGMTTLPAISPGEPVCHLGRLPRGVNPADLLRLRSHKSALEERVVEDLSSNLLVTNRSEEE